MRDIITEVALASSPSGDWDRAHLRDLCRRLLPVLECAKDVIEIGDQFIKSPSPWLEEAWKQKREELRKCLQSSSG